MRLFFFNSCSYNTWNETQLLLHPLVFLPLLFHVCPYPLKKKNVYKYSSYISSISERNFYISRSGFYFILFIYCRRGMIVSLFSSSILIQLAGRLDCCLLVCLAVCACVGSVNENGRRCGHVPQLKTPVCEETKRSLGPRLHLSTQRYIKQRPVTT